MTSLLYNPEQVVKKHEIAKMEQASGIFDLKAKSRAERFDRHGIGGRLNYYNLRVSQVVEQQRKERLDSMRKEKNERERDRVKRDLYEPTQSRTDFLKKKVEKAKLQYLQKFQDDASDIVVIPREEPSYASLSPTRPSQSKLHGSSTKAYDSEARNSCLEFSPSTQTPKLQNQYFTSLRPNKAKLSVSRPSKEEQSLGRRLPLVSKSVISMYSMTEEKRSKVANLQAQHVHLTQSDRSERDSQNDNAEINIEDDESRMKRYIDNIFRIDRLSKAPNHRIRVEENPLLEEMKEVNERSIQQQQDKLRSDEKFRRYLKKLDNNYNRQLRELEQRGFKNFVAQAHAQPLPKKNAKTLFSQGISRDKINQLEQRKTLDQSGPAHYRPNYMYTIQRGKSNAGSFTKQKRFSQIRDLNGSQSQGSIAEYDDVEILSKSKSQRKSHLSSNRKLSKVTVNEELGTKRLLQKGAEIVVQQNEYPNAAGLKLAQNHQLTAKKFVTTTEVASKRKSQSSKASLPKVV